jgi:hypothetical protein
MTLPEVAAAIGQMSPVILGVLAYVFIPRKDRQKPAPAVETPTPPPMGMTVDFEAIAVESLHDQIEYLKGQLGKTEARLELAHTALRAAGLPIP